MTYDLELSDEVQIQQWWDGLDGDLVIEWLEAWETRDQQERVHLNDACRNSLPDGVVASRRMLPTRCSRTSSRTGWQNRLDDLGIARLSRRSAG